MLSKKLIKMVCIHEASHLFIAKVLGNQLISMEMDVKKGWARVLHYAEAVNTVNEAAIKVAGYLADKHISKMDVNFRNEIYASQITDHGIIFGDYDEFKLAHLGQSRERKIIRAATAAIIKNQKKIKAVANHFISRMDKNKNISIKKREINKLFNDLGIVKDEELSNKLIQ